MIMIERTLSYGISHLMIRVAAIFSLLWLTLCLLFTSFYYLTKVVPVVNLINPIWIPLSTVVLPLCVVAEAIWMRGEQDQIKKIKLDAGISVSWFLIYWSFYIYTVVHPAFV